ncbi:MAG: NAD(P)/FAD-dependent oxidoreductase [Tardiphaga sp.]|uniref:NAD(P)/FAD-dependent oxidoreductase n=1 Tax=Tardiphaga sp. TaxID=1926292 RepID=UPI00262AC5E0|nr:NAD(P)/FAD-dependent oxidoreductase [Tardiphaga sp.]MDB5503384.1 NAD(P)/FAD-dependent oxidoreductase [Tardiphaga sp.]
MDLSLYESIAETPSTNDPTQHRVLIVGGGAAGLHLASKLGAHYGRKGKISVTLLDKSRVHVWKPLLHEVAAGSFDAETDAVELIAHAKLRHYRYRIGEMIGINRARQQIYVAPTDDDAGTRVIPPRVLGYDTLVIAIGSLSNDFGTPGVMQHAITLDTLDQAVRFNRRMMDACLRANAQYEPLRPGQLHCAIVGAGATGVELAAELHKSMRDLASYNLDNIDFDKTIKIELIEAGPRILLALPEGLAADTTKLLESLGINVRTGTPVMSVEADGVTLNSGEFIPAELIVWAAGIKAPDVLRDFDGLESDRINRLIVKPTLQTTRDDNIFALGDCAYCVPEGANAPLPPRAQTAQQQANFMVGVIAQRLDGQPLSHFKYHDRGSLVALSDYKTFGVIFRGFRLEGFFAMLAYRALHKLHLLALFGPWRVALNFLAGLLTKRTEPRVKLH